MKEIKSILVSMLFFIIIYLLCAFYSADFNIKNWETSVKFVNSYIGGIISLFAGFAFYFKDKK